MRLYSPWFVRYRNLLAEINEQVEIKRTIPKGSSESKDFKTKKIFVGGILTSVSDGKCFHSFFPASMLIFDTSFLVGLLRLLIWFLPSSYSFKLGVLVFR